MLFMAVAVPLMLVSCKNTVSSEQSKPRTIVTSDGEIDDFDSFIRFLLYVNEFDIEGLIYSSSRFHWSGDGKGTVVTTQRRGVTVSRTSLRWCGTEWMQNFIDEYSMVYDNLLKHDDSYPDPDYLKSLIKIGNIEFEGDMSKDTEGSDWIKSILLDDEPGPVYIQVWGGTNTAARALKSIEEQYKDTPEWQDIYKKVSEKAVIYIILDQDVTYRNYIAPNWSDVKIIYNSRQFGTLAYSWSRNLPDELMALMNGPWFTENIKFSHGPLLDSYYLWGDGQIIEGDSQPYWDTAQLAARGRLQYDFISEGDSPSYFYLLSKAFGLRCLEDPAAGGLGGRFVRNDSVPRRWEDGQHVTDLSPYTGQPETSYPQVRWFETLQNDFAARADWCIMDYEEANHAPVVTLNHRTDLDAKPGKTVRLSGRATDPDGDQLTYSWWQYVEAGTYQNAVTIEGQYEQSASFIVPAEAKTGDTIHIILEVTDNGSPNLKKYQRVIVTVK